MATLLLVAADRMELAALDRRMGGKDLNWPLDFARAGELAGHRLLAVANGAGPRLAAQAVTVAAAREPLDAVVSAGYCGGLDPRLHPGSVVVAWRVEAPEMEESFFSGEVAAQNIFTRGSIISIDRFVRTSGEKRRLGAGGAVALEMEAAGVARSARELGLPFFCVRVVTDVATEDFAIDFNRTRDAEGRFCNRRLIPLSLRHPCRCGLELLRLYRRSRAASETLGEFLGTCEYKL